MGPTLVLTLPGTGRVSVVGQDVGLGQVTCSLLQGSDCQLG